MSTLINDRQWIQQSLFLSGESRDNGVEGTSLSLGERRSQRFSAADINFSDTTPGGCYFLNPKPQFTRWADPKRPGINSASCGMGDYYTDAFYNNYEVVHFQFGLPDYNSITNIAGRYYDDDIGRLANTGDASSFSFFLGKAVGYVLTAPFQIVNSAVNFVRRLWNWANNTPYSRFYYMTPNMPLYWSTVSNLFTRIGSNMGIISSPSSDDVKAEDKGTVTSTNKTGGMSGSEFSLYQSMLPDVIMSNGNVDVFAISTRGQRLAQNHYKTLNEIEKRYEGQSFEAFQQALLRYMETGFTEPRPKKEFSNLPDYLNNFYKKGTIGQGEGAKDPGSSIEASSESSNMAQPVGDKGSGIAMANSSVDMARVWDKPSMLDYFKNELEDGAAFMSLAVDYSGPVTESFSNSFKTSDVVDALNSASATGRSWFQSFQGGNIGEGVVASAIEGFAGAVGNLVKGGLSSVGLGGLAQLGGAAYIDAPEYWEQATAQLPTMQYTITLETPYANKMAILTRLMLPLTCILAGGLPRSTGKASYTSPFLCAIYNQGKVVSKLSMIDAISIRRGDANVGWTADNLPTKFTIDVSVKDLTPIMHVPVSELGGIGDLLTLSVMDEDTPLTDYLAALSGLSVNDQYYFQPRLKLAWRNQLSLFNSWTSPAHWASYFAGTETMANRFLGVFARTTSR